MVVPVSVKQTIVIVLMSLAFIMGLRALGEVNIGPKDKKEANRMACNAFCKECVHKVLGQFGKVDVTSIPEVGDVLFKAAAKACKAQAEKDSRFPIGCPCSRSNSL